MLVAWIAFPLVLAGLCLGCGLLVEVVSGRRLGFALLPAAGLALIVVVGQFLTLFEATAELTTPAVVALAVAGVGLSLPGRGRRPSGWGLAAVAGAFAVFALPIVASGEPTFAGYIRLDDTATWMTLTDRVMEAGRSLDGLAPSTYEATLAFNIGDGYPVGVFLPLGVGTKLVGTDVAWLVQPYMAFLGAVLAASLWALAAPLVESRPLRAAVVFIASQSALLFGYYLWGGIKEIAAAALIAAFAAGCGRLIAERFPAARVLQLGLVGAALIGVLDVGGVLWLAPALVLVLVLALRSLDLRAVAARAALLAGMLIVLSIPVLTSGGLLPPTSSPLTDSGAKGNLIEALEPAQVAGIWPAGDFRIDPVEGGPAYVLIAVAVGAAIAGLLIAWRRRAWAPLAYVGGTLLACFALYAVGSPWVGGKALATASPAIPFAAGLAFAWLFAHGRRVEGAVLAAAVAGGVLWSNVLAYGDVDLAPRDQLAELEAIGDEVAGEGPSLMTEYSPYGARHFLRESDAEGISELRRSPIPLVDGSTVPKGGTADTDQIDPVALGAYRTVVLRRSPAQSRPPSPYELIRRGDFYEVWQRPEGEPLLPERIGLGDRYDPYGVPDCDAVLELASRGDLVAATGPPPIVVPLSDASYPAGWAPPSARQAPIPLTAGTIEATVEVPEAGEYEVWIGGSLRPRVELRVDGEPAGSVRHLLNNEGQYVRLGAAELGPGPHRVEVEISGDDLHPGSAGTAGAIGPLVLAAGDAADSELVEVPAADARSLCGQRWDWIELAG